MRADSPQICPLCGIPAYYEAEDHGDLKHFYCDTCSEFIISVQAEVVLKSTSLEMVRVLSHRAREAREDEYLCITVPSREQQDGIASPRLEVRFVERGAETDG